MLRHRPNSIVSLGDGTEAYMELNADSAADLATTYEGYNIAAGSICLDISTGDFYVLDGRGNWVNQTGESTAASALSTTAINDRAEKLGFDGAISLNEVTEDADVLGNADSDTK